MSDHDEYSISAGSAPPGISLETSRSPLVENEDAEATPCASIDVKSLMEREEELVEEQFRHHQTSLFEEAAEATLLSAGCFAIADLRAIALAKERKISQDDADEILHLPITIQRMRTLEKKHEHLYKKFRSHDFTTNVQSYLGKTRIPASMEIHYVGDENPDSQCVHIIGRSHFRGEIVLAFRGSVTNNDWLQDLKLMIAKVPNPLSHVDDQPKEVGVHLGFKSYLTYGRTVGGKTETIALSKMEIIINQLKALKLQYPKDTIFICGHSLGGALALIAALAVAADPYLGKLPPDTVSGPAVTCYTVGNPKPGDGDFCNAIEYLEQAKKLRCCVIHNTWDVVPMLAMNMKRTNAGFWHPGWKILLYKDRCEIGRSRSPLSKFHEDAENAQCACSSCRCCCCRRQSSEAMWTKPKGFNVMKAATSMSKRRVNTHNHREYLERLLLQQNYLRKLTLNELYEDDVWREGGGGVD